MDALILAGGQNRRFFFHKGLAEIHGKRLIDITSSLLRIYFKYFYLGLPMIGDIINFYGPLTGIFSALLSTGAPEVFVAACYMPFISDGRIKLIKDSYKVQDAVIPVFICMPQPLLGI